jgi:hypothetical protein
MPMVNHTPQFDRIPQLNHVNSEIHDIDRCIHSFPSYLEVAGKTNAGFADQRNIQQTAYIVQVDKQSQATKAFYRTLAGRATTPVY